MQAEEMNSQSGFFETIKQMRRQSENIEDPLDQFFDQYEMNHILDFTLTSQITFLTMMNYTRCERDIQSFSFGHRELTITHPPLGQYTQPFQKPNIRVERDSFAECIFLCEQKQAVVGLIAGNNSHCKVTNTSTNKDPFNLQHRLRKIMSRGHNAEVITHTSYIIAAVHDQVVKKLSDRPQLYHSRVIRAPNGQFILGKNIDIMTVLDPEVHGFEKWLQSFIWNLDEAVIQGVKTLHVVFPSASEGSKAIIGLSVAIQLCVMCYTILFQEIIIHPDELGYFETITNFEVINKNFGFIHESMLKTQEKYKAKCRAGVCFKNMCTQKIEMNLCQKQRYMFQLHPDTLELLQRLCPSLCKYIPTANFSTKSKGLNCQLQICCCTSQMHTDFGLVASHQQACDHGIFCFVSNCGRAHQSVKNAPLCIDGVQCVHLNSQSEESLFHLREFQHSSFIQCPDLNCQSIDDAHYQLFVHQKLFRQQCIMGNLCQEQTNLLHLQRYWHLKGHVFTACQPNFPAYCNNARYLRNEKCQFLVDIIRTWKSFIPLDSYQFASLVYANKFLSSYELRQGQWFLDSTPPSISSCVRLIQSGARKRTIITWLQLSGGAPPMKPKEDVNSSFKTPNVDKPKSKFSLSSVPTVSISKSKQISRSASPETYKRQENKNKDIMYYNVEIVQFEQIILNSIMSLIWTDIQADRNTQCLLKYGSNFDVMIDETNILMQFKMGLTPPLVLNDEFIDITNLWKKVTKKIYQSISENPELNRFVHINISRYVASSQHVKRTLMIDKLTTEQAIFNTDYFAEDRVDNPQVPEEQQYVVNYAHVISQYYASAISYQIHVQDCERKNWYNFLITNKDIINGSSPILDLIPNMDTLSVVPQQAEDILNQNELAAQPEQQIVTYFGPQKEEINQFQVLILSDSFVCGPHTQVSFQGQNYSMMKESDIYKFAETLNQIAEKLLGYTVQNIDEYQQFIKISNVFTNKEIAVKFYNDSYSSDLLSSLVSLIIVNKRAKDQKPADNDDYRMCMCRADIRNVIIVDSVSETLQNIHNQSYDVIKGASFASNNFIQMPFIIKSFELKEPVYFSFDMTWDSDVLIQIAGKTIRIYQFFVVCEQIAAPLLDKREAVHSGYSKILFALTFVNSIPVLQISALYSILQVPDIILSGLNSQDNKIYVYACKPVFNFYQHIDNPTNKLLGIRHKRSLGKQKSDKLAEILLTQWVNELLSKPVLNQPQTQILEQCNHIFTKLKLKQEPKVLDTISYNLKQIIENPGAFAFLYSTISLNQSELELV